MTGDDLSETEATPPVERPKLTVKRFFEPGLLKADLQYSVADLSQAMTDQAALYAHYGVQAASAARQTDDMELRLDVTKARVAREVRDAAAIDGRKMSVAEVEAEVLTDQRIIDLRVAVNAAKQVEAEAKTAVEAFRHRKDMLVQLGAGEREEKKGSLTLRLKEAQSQHIGGLESLAIKMQKESA